LSSPGTRVPTPGLTGRRSYTTAWDATGKTHTVVDHNAKASELYGYSGADLVTRRLDELTTQPTRVLQSVQRTVSERRAMDGSHLIVERGIHGIHRKKDGTEFPVHMSIGTLVLGPHHTIVGIVHDLSELRGMEIALAISRSELKTITSTLEQKKAALNELLDRVRSDRDAIEDRVQQNVERLIEPALSKLRARLEGRDRRLVDLIVNDLTRLTSPSSAHVARKGWDLTLREIEICNAIRGGLSSKEIGAMLGISSRSVDVHRQNIRNKLGIVGKKGQSRRVPLRDRHPQTMRDRKMVARAPDLAE